MANENFSTVLLWDSQLGHEELIRGHYFHKKIPGLNITRPSDRNIISTTLIKKGAENVVFVTPAATMRWLFAVKKGADKYNPNLHPLAFEKPTKFQIAQDIYDGDGDFCANLINIKNGIKSCHYKKITTYNVSTYLKLVETIFTSCEYRSGVEHHIKKIYFTSTLPWEVDSLEFRVGKELFNKGLKRRVENMGRFDRAGINIAYLDLHHFYKKYSRKEELYQISLRDGVHWTSNFVGKLVDAVEDELLENQ